MAKPSRRAIARVLLREHGRTYSAEIGDLRKLREDAGRDPDAERRLLKGFKGIGGVGADIFFREVQGAWGELYPFVDTRARAGDAATREEILRSAA